MTVAVAARQRWMSALALATRDEIETAWRRVAGAPAYAILRGPEIGLVMVRARAGGTGARFNAGETPVVRCSVEVQGGAVGHAWVRGRDRRHAELAAVLDALLQDAGRRATLLTAVVEPLEAAREARRRAALDRGARTRVDFFTMVRGDD